MTPFTLQSFRRTGQRIRSSREIIVIGHRSSHAELSGSVSHSKNSRHGMTLNVATKVPDEFQISENHRIRQEGTRVGINSQRGGISQERDYASRNATIQQMLKEMDTLFSHDATDISRLKFDSFVLDWLPTCNPMQISEVMRRAGKKTKCKSFLYLRRHLPAFATRLEYLSSWPLKFMHISFILYSLQCLNENDRGYSRIVLTMSKVATETIKTGKRLPSQNLSMMLLGLQSNKLEKRESIKLLSTIAIMIGSCAESLSAQAVGNALYGLQGMSSDHAEVLSVLSALVPKINSCTEFFDSQAVGNALYGLQSMSSHHSEVLSTLSALVPKIHGCTEVLSAQAISNALYGLQGMSSDHAEVLSVLSALVPKINSCTEFFDSQAVSNSLYGLQSMSSHQNEVLSILSALVPKIRSCTKVLSAQAISNALYGLQGMGSDHAEVLSVLSALVPKIRSCKEIFSSQAVSNSLYGLQSMSSDHAEVLLILSALVPRIRSCEEIFSSQAVSNSLYGLQGMSSHQNEVLSVLSALVPKIRSCEEIFSSQAVSNSLYGLQSMSSDHAEVLLILSALVPRIRSCSQSLTAQDVGNALYGLQGMSSSHNELLLVLSALLPKIHSCEVIFSPQAVSNSLYGLQSMSSDHAEVLLILSALVPRIRSCSQSLTAQDVGNALYGLQGVLIASPSLSILNFLTTHLTSLDWAGRQSRVDLVTLGQALALTLPSLRSTVGDRNYGEWEAISTLIHNELSLSEREKSAEVFPTLAEARMHSIAMKALDSSDVRVSVNEHLFGLFESDIVLRIPFSVKDVEDPIGHLTVIVEVDGVHHKLAKKLRFCSLRDEHFRSLGVSVERIAASKLKWMSNDDVLNWLLDLIANTILESASK